MSERQNGHRGTVAIHRILVAVDASRDSQAALRAAVQMAARFHAELEGLFVEDLNVLRAAQIPLAQELGHYTGYRRRISAREIERAIHLRVQQMRRLFRILTEQESVRGTFHVARGMVQTEIKTAAASADVLIVGRVGWAQTSPERLGATAEAMCSDEAPRVTAVLREGSVLAPPVVVLYEGSPAGDKALRIGAALVDEMSEPLQVLVGCISEECIAKLKTRANACLRSAHVMRQYRMLPSSGVRELVQTIHDMNAGTLVLSGDADVVQEGRVSGLLSQIDIPVLLVR